MSAKNSVEVQAVSSFVDGGLTQSEEPPIHEVVNPSNGQRILTMAAGSVSGVDRAVRSARRAFESGCWSEEPPSVRKKALFRLADLMEQEAAQLDALDAEEMGKPISEAAFNAAAAAGLVRFYAESVDKVTGDVYSSDKASLIVQRRVPRGVVAALVPWNFPVFVAALKFAPALAAGNCVVLKPSEVSSRSALRIAHLAVQAGIPPGVLNIVPGLGETVGRALGLHQDVDLLTFTGSTAVGKLMVQYAGQSNLKVVMAECGGKSPQIVFADGVDLSAASESIARFMLTNQGQICSVGSRLLVQRSIETEVLERIAGHFKQISMGAATDAQTTFGPVASARQCSRIMQYIDSAQGEGAELVAGGKRALQTSGGFFIEPTLFRNVAPTSRLAQEEIFGPVLAVSSFETEAEAIQIANSTMYGLGAYVWTTSLSTAMRAAKAIKSDVVVSSAAYKGEGAGFAASWEPVGQSGFGTESGLAGMASYMRRHLVAFQHA